MPPRVIRRRTTALAILGAVLARQVATREAAGTPSAVAYGDATGHLFAISAAVSLLGVLAAILLKPVSLRTSLHLADAVKAAAVAADTADGAPAVDTPDLADPAPGTVRRATAERGPA